MWCFSVVSTGARSAERRDLLSTISGLSWREGLSARPSGPRSRRRKSPRAIAPGRLGRFTSTMVLRAKQCRPSVLVDFDGLHHAHLFMVHHVAVQHVDAGVVEEATTESERSAFALDDGGVAPLRRGQRLAVQLRHKERIGVDVERVIVVFAGILDRPFLDGAELDPLVDARGVELLAVDQETELL